MHLKCFRSVCNWIFFFNIVTTFKTNKMPDGNLLLAELSVLNCKCHENKNDFNNFRTDLI